MSAKARPGDSKGQKTWIEHIHDEEKRGREVEGCLSTKIRDSHQGHPACLTLKVILIKITTHLWFNQGNSNSGQ